MADAHAKLPGPQNGGFDSYRRNDMALNVSKIMSNASERSGNGGSRNESRILFFCQRGIFIVLFQCLIVLFCIIFFLVELDSLQK